MVKKILKYFPYIFHIIYFNFRYLPFRQAIVFPIFLYRPKLLKLKGKVLIKNKNIRIGMIKLGEYNVSLYPNTGIVWENHGGEDIFFGTCIIGNSSAISIGEYRKVIFGENFVSTASLKIAAYHSVHFGKNVLVGWDNIFIDTDFHQTRTVSRIKKRSYGAITIGDNNWFGVGRLTLKNTLTNNDTIISAKSVLNKQYNYSDYSVIGGIPAKLIAKDIYRNPYDDKINYENPIANL